MKLAFLSVICVAALAAAQDQGGAPNSAAPLTQPKAVNSAIAPKDPPDASDAAEERVAPAELHADLKLTASIKTQMGGRTLGGMKCDEEGNIYVQTDQPGNRTFLQKIKPDGTLAAAFKVTDALPDLWALAYFVSGSGDVYAAAYSGWKDTRKYYVVQFSSDGAAKSKTKFDAEFFTPRQIAVFKSGEFLLSGPAGDSLGSFTAVFDASGKLLKKISEPEDAEFKKRAEAGDTTVTSSFGSSNLAVELGDAVAASDGNVYLMRRSSPAVVYAISPTGEVVRKLRVDPDDWAAPGGTIKAAPGRLAIHFARDARSGLASAGVIKVVDFEGNPLATYTVGIHANFFACYTPPTLTFSARYEDGLHLNQAEPK